MMDDEYIKDVRQSEEVFQFISLCTRTLVMFLEEVENNVEGD